MSQSQNNLLEEVSSWDSQTCHQRLDEVLPQLISLFSNAEDNVIDVLQVLFQSVLPVVPTQNIEELLLSKVTAKLTAYFDKTLSRVAQVTEVESVIADLQLALSLVGCVELCVCDLLRREDELRMSFIHSLPPLVVYILQGSYTHCKESSMIYKELLSSVSEPLSALFRKAHSLQTEFIRMIDKVVVDSSQDDLRDMSAVIHGVCDLTDVATSLDVKIMITIWKTTSRWLCRYKQQLSDWLDVARIVGSLSSDICASYCHTTTLMSQDLQGMEDRDEEKLINKNVKIIGFQMKVLVSIVKEFTDCLGNCIPQLVVLILTLQSRVPPCLLAVKIRRCYTDDIERHVTSGIHPLLSYLVPIRQFMQCLTTAEQDSALHLPRCLTLITVAGLLTKYPEDIRSMWIDPRKPSPESAAGLPLMNAVFDCLIQCYTELCLPVKLSGSVAGKPQRVVPLYEYIVTRMCAFAAIHSPEQFHVIENCLLENIFSRNLHSALLAADIWCFLARCGTANLCHQHCVFLAKLYCTVSPSSAPQCCHLAALLRRMFKLLTLEYQERFVSQFPVSPSNLALWSAVSVSHLDASLRHRVTERVVTVCTQVMQGWCRVTTRHVDDAINLDTAVTCLTNVYRSETVSEHTDSKRQHLVVEALHETWQTLSVTAVAQYAVLQNVVSSMFSLAAYVQSELDNKQVLLLVKNASAYLAQGVGDHVKLAILCFLEHLGAKILPPTFEQDQILRTLSSLYGRLLADTNCVVHRTALVSFAQFAEKTRHESVVPECLHGDRRVQESVVQYLNQLGGAGPTVDTDKDYLDTQGQAVRARLAKTVLAQSDMDTIPSTTTQIPSKRLNDESSGEAEERDVAYQNILSQLEHGLDSLSETSRNTPLPAWVFGRLHYMHRQLTELIKE